MPSSINKDNLISGTMQPSTVNKLHQNYTIDTDNVFVNTYRIFINLIGPVTVAVDGLDHASLQADHTPRMAG